MSFAFASHIPIPTTQRLIYVASYKSSRFTSRRTAVLRRPRHRAASTLFAAPAMSAADSRTERAPLAHGFQYDLFVIGAGSGGVRASRIAATHGARVAVAENGPLGGTCVNVGCVPKKLLVYGSHYGHDFADAQAYGWNVEKPTLDWTRMIGNKNDEIKRLNGIYDGMLGRAGVDIVHGTAKFVDTHTIDVAGTQYTADKILIASGGRPFVPKIEGSEHIITSNEAFYLKEHPKRVVLVGGGYIAVEFACIFHGFGSEVVQIYRGEKFLRGFDDDVRDHLATEMRTQGIDLRFGVSVEKITKNDDGSLSVHTNGGEVIVTDVAMYATGRVPNTKPMSLEKADIEVGEKGEIKVDDWGHTNVPSVYAIGDVTDRVQLTPVAIAEGHALADTLYGNKKRNISYEYIPTAVFSNPSIGTCGLTETQAREKYGALGVDIYKTTFRPMKHTLTKREGEKVFMKLVVERATDKVVGCHLLEAAAGEIIQMAGIAMKMGATKADFDATMPVHPVSAEEMVTLRTKEPDP